jgi:CheY-like chemotaxis protein
MAKTLLLADGSVTIQRVIELTFAHEDVRVVSVADGARAIQWLDAERADIVLVDVDLPEVDGYSVAAHMKKSAKLRQVPVLLLAGAFDPVDQDRLRAIGCDGVIVKPFEPQVVVSRVKELLAVVPTPAKREVKPVAAAPMGPADSPALAVLKSAAEARQVDEPDRRLPKPEPVFTRRAPEPVPAPTAYERGTMPIGQPEPLEPPTRLVWDTGSTAAQPVTPTPQAAPPAAAPAPAAPKVSLASAFSALLAAEQSAQPAAPAAAPVAPALTEASVEEAVRRVLVRMTDDLVRRIVVETAERLIKEEIEKIKASPE